MQLQPESFNGADGDARSLRTGSCVAASKSSSAPPTLTADQLATVRLLSREGNREIVIRQVLGIAAREWRELKAAEDSPLAEALELGRAEGAGLVITFMRTKMQDGSMEAAKWLGEHVFKITRPAPEDAGGQRTTNILMLPAPMSEAEFRSIIEGTASVVSPPKEIAHG